MKMIEYFGTTWVVPESWIQTKPDMVVGDTGILTLAVVDGTLVDEALCVKFSSAKGGTWSLVRAMNGVSLWGTYIDGGTVVQVYVVQADCRRVNIASAMPTIQASYVVYSRYEDILAVVRRSMGQKEITSREYGMVDNYGHLAMGPVPVSTRWLPVGDVNGNASMFPRNASGAVTEMLVGGGWIDFHSEDACCGLTVAPIAWTDQGAEWERLEAIRETDRAAVDTVVVSDVEARVWRWVLAKNGISFQQVDPLGGVRVVGAIWRDKLEQMWEIRYFFCRRHDMTVREIVRLASSRSTAS